MNRNKNPLKIIKDLSKNTIDSQKTTIYVDSSGELFDFLQKRPLDNCKGKKYTLIKKTLPLIDTKKNINTIVDNKLKMRIKKILDEIRKKDNESENWKNMRRRLDNQKSIVPVKNDSNIFNLISDINTSYNTIFSANYNDKSHPKVGFTNSNQIYNPPSVINRHSNPYTQFLKRPRRVLPTPKPFPSEPIKYKHICIDVEINTIQDFLELCEKYPLKIDVKYNIDMKAIHSIKKPLTSLNNMIGMNALKSSIVDQIIFFIQNLHKNKTDNDFMHTVVCGPPGTGKTEVAKIMGHIFSNLGILSRNKFKKVTRADMIAGYLGQTAIKTKEVIESALGGVLFIDEAYALGNHEKRDSFAKECIDTLCEGLSDHKDNLMVIIAGYEDELNKCFFNYNKGLDSRFTWRFKIDDYTPAELKQIFEKKINDIDWKLKSKNEIPIAWFEKNSSYFTFYGRDMETLLAKTKIAHGKRVFCKKEEEKKKITLEDLENGFKIYLDNGEVKKRGKEDIPLYLYT